MDQSGHDPQTLLTCTFFFYIELFIIVEFIYKIKKKINEEAIGHIEYCKKLIFFSIRK